MTLSRPVDLAVAMEALDSDSVRLLCDSPPDTFVPLRSNERRVQTVGLWSVDADQSSVRLTPDSRVQLRPDLLPIHEQGMVVLDPLYVGVHSVGWLVHLPALPQQIGRNYVRVTRRRSRPVEAACQR